MKETIDKLAELTSFIDGQISDIPRVDRMQAETILAYENLQTNIDRGLAIYHGDNQFLNYMEAVVPVKESLKIFTQTLTAWVVHIDEKLQ